MIIEERGAVQYTCRRIHDVQAAPVLAGDVVDEQWAVHRQNCITIVLIVDVHPGSPDRGVAAEYRGCHRARIPIGIEAAASVASVVALECDACKVI